MIDARIEPGAGSGRKVVLGAGCNCLSPDQKSLRWSGGLSPISLPVLRRAYDSSLEHLWPAWMSSVGPWSIG